MDLSRFSGHDQAGDFEPAPAGVHAAVCVAVIDLGTQREKKFQSDELVDKPKLAIRWEIDEKRDDGKPFIVQAWYTASMHEKASLRKDLESWRGTPFKTSDFEPGAFSMAKILGQGCQLQIVHTENGKAKISAIMKLAKGQKAPRPDIVPFMIDLESPATFDRGAFDELGEGMKQIIAKSPEFQTIVSATVKKPAPSPAAAKTNGTTRQQAKPEPAEDDPFEDSIPF